MIRKLDLSAISPIRSARPTPLPREPRPDEFNADKETKAVHAQLQGALCCPLEERKQLVRQLQLKYHPDKNPGKEEVYTLVFQFLMNHKEWFLLGVSGKKKGGGRKI